MQRKCVPLRSGDDVAFAVFCIEGIASRLGVSGADVCRALTQKSDILNGYIVPCYDILHTQGREYVVDDILEVMAGDGVSV